MQNAKKKPSNWILLTILFPNVLHTNVPFMFFYLIFWVTLRITPCGVDCLIFKNKIYT